VLFGTHTYNLGPYVQEYYDDIWNVSQISISLNGNDGLGFLQSLQRSRVSGRRECTGLPGP